MSDNSFSHYSTKKVHFLDQDEELSEVLKRGLVIAGRNETKITIADLGCGDGRLIFALYVNGFLHEADILGIDISNDRINRLKKNLPFVKGITSNALSVMDLSDASINFLICSQVIEHVDDKLLLFEIKRLLARNGLSYISTVTKKWYGIYFYFNNGAFRLDPTHIREYSSTREFVNLVQKVGFDIIAVKGKSTMFPFIDIVIRLFIKFGFLEPNVNFYSSHKLLIKLRKLKVPIIGYQTCEVLVRKQ